LPQGIIREGFTCDFTVYPFGDVRGRQVVTRAFADRLVATGLWSIFDESIPTTNFTSDTTYYRIWLKFGNSSRYFRLQVRGGTNASNLNMDISLLQTNSTTAVLVPGSATALCHSTLGYTRLGLQTIYGPSWMIFLPISYGLNYQDPTVATYPICVQTFEDFLATENTMEGIFMWSSQSGQASMSGALTGYMYVDGIEYTALPGASYIPPANPNIELMAPSFGPNGTNWRRKDVYGFSNKIGVVVGSVLSINDHYFMLMSNSLIADLGAIP